MYADQSLIQVLYTNLLKLSFRSKKWNNWKSKPENYRPHWRELCNIYIIHDFSIQLFTFI